MIMINHFFYKRLKKIAIKLIIIVKKLTKRNVIFIFGIVV